ncbi:PAS domain-containing protein [Chelativorans sp.]|uniref:sensor histidine kinase n=1 Tax=Chelativorans sp. TaxID=2203393 RepID=UPI00281126F4|nr:PAS domain-containing protein [Chelativorans sp.]
MVRIDFERVFEALSSPHMVVDRQLRYVAVNAAYERVTMRTREEMIGRHLFDLFPNEGESGRRLRSSFERVFATGEMDSLPYISYDIQRPEEQGGGMEQRYWSAVHTPLGDGEGNVAYVVQNTVDVTELVRLRQAAHLPFRFGEIKLLERAQEAERQHSALLEEAEDFRRLFQQAPGFIAVLSGPEHIFTFANDAYLRLIGGRAVLGKKVRDALPEVEGQGFFEMLDRVLATGQPTGGEAVRLFLQRAAGEEPRETFVDFSYDPIRDGAGQVTGIFVQGMDRTEAVKTQRRQRLLLDELNHRVKNTLATVQSIASQTMRSARDLESARADLEARIVALSKAHDLLSAQQWANTELTTLVRQELSVHDRDRVRVDGPWLLLDPKTSIALALVTHELSTNAAKYGALSSANGKVSVNWRLSERQPRDLQLVWTERDGPPVEAPRRRGFGSRMIERVVSGELGGTYEAEFSPQGFACRINIPLNA